MNRFFQSTHPKNGHDVNIEFDEDQRLVAATYTDGEDVELTNMVKSHFQSDIEIFCKDEESEEQA